MTETFLEKSTGLHIRVWGEFQTMPGLRLTLEQGCRLFDSTPSDVETVFNDLIDASVLRQVGPYYIRADFGDFTA